MSLKLVNLNYISSQDNGHFRHLELQCQGQTTHEHYDLGPDRMLSKPYLLNSPRAKQARSTALLRQLPRHVAMATTTTDESRAFEHCRSCSQTRFRHFVASSSRQARRFCADSVRSTGLRDTARFSRSAQRLYRGRRWLSWPLRTLLRYHSADSARRVRPLPPHVRRFQRHFNGRAQPNSRAGAAPRILSSGGRVSWGA